MRQEVRKYLGTVVLAAVIVIAACARQGFPPGGPEDKTPPELAKVTPAPLSANVPTGTSVIFEFSKPMNHRSVEDNLFIVPIPADWPRISWRSGDRVMVLDFPRDIVGRHADHVIPLGVEPVAITVADGEKAIPPAGKPHQGPGTVGVGLGDIVRHIVPRIRHPR